MPYEFTAVEKFFVLLFGAIVIGIIVTNPRGVRGVFEGLATFTRESVNAFSGGKGFVNQSGF